MHNAWRFKVHKNKEKLKESLLPNVQSGGQFMERTFRAQKPNIGGHLFVKNGVGSTKWKLGNGVSLSYSYGNFTGQFRFCEFRLGTMVEVNLEEKEESFKQLMKNQIKLRRVQVQFPKGNLLEAVVC